MGKCGRCGKPLTVPESIASGFGPDCREMMGMAAAPVVAASGTAAPQPNLNFDCFGRQPNAKPAVKAHDVPVLVPTQEIGIHAATDNGRERNVGELDAMIRASVVAYRSEAPENYYQDGELDEKQAFNVAYHMFRV